MEREKQREVERQREMEEREKLLEQRKRDEEAAILELQREKEQRKFVWIFFVKSSISKECFIDFCFQESESSEDEQPPVEIRRVPEKLVVSSEERFQEMVINSTRNNFFLISKTNFKHFR
jgi:CRISPR/Cas system CMR subunit Cmr4 (Cas7 group RAMP superfamily)